MIMVSINLKIDDSFYQQEERCGFLVTRKTKEIWAIEIDLIDQLDRVCKKYGLKYCVGAGTMLGAVRHHGFIPWDDDVDVYMLRDDYDKLMEHAHDFCEPYFLQNSVTEPNLLKKFARLRNSSTLGATTREIDLPINNGIFIDIFPIDGISANRIQDFFQSIRNTFYKDVFGCFNYSKTLVRPQTLNEKIKLTLYKFVAAVFASDKERVFNRYKKNITRYSSEGIDLWGNRTLIFACPKSRRRKIDYEDLIYMPFEMISVPVPRNYDSMLRQQYGDYMKIPEHKGENMHGELIISTDYAYNDPRRTQK